MDKVGDLLIRIKNGYMASKKEVEVVSSKLNLTICELLQREGYIQSCKKEERCIKVVLKYDSKQPALIGVKRISKPGRRVYKGSKQMTRVFNGLGIAVVSTPRGIMTDRDARKEKVGGEVMAYIW